MELTDVHGRDSWLGCRPNCTLHYLVTCKQMGLHWRFDCRLLCGSYRMARHHECAQRGCYQCDHVWGRLRDACRKSGVHWCWWNRRGSSLAHCEYYVSVSSVTALHLLRYKVA